jgi:hypothetical protein
MKGGALSDSKLLEILIVVKYHSTKYGIDALKYVRHRIVLAVVDILTTIPKVFISCDFFSVALSQPSGLRQNSLPGNIPLIRRPSGK